MFARHTQAPKGKEWGFATAKLSKMIYIKKK